MSVGTADTDGKMAIPGGDDPNSIAPDEARPAPEDDVRSYPELLQRVPAIVYIADKGPQGRWYYVSPQIEPILGYPPEEWCADPRLWLERIHAEDRETVLASQGRPARSVDGARRGGGYGAVAADNGNTDHNGNYGGEDPDDGRDGIHETIAQEYRMLHRDGSVVWIRDEARLVRDQTGRLRWHGVLSDITERKQVEAKLEQRAAQQAAVALLGEHGLEGASTIELMNEAVSAAAKGLGIDFAGVLELLPDEDCFVPRCGFGLRQSAVGTHRVSAGEDSLPGCSVITSAPAVVNDWSTEERFTQSPGSARRGIQSELAVAIEGRSGPFGVLAVQSLVPRIFTAGDIGFLQSLANVLGDALERQAIEDDTRHRALHDPLTGLPNRVLFLDRLEHALARLKRRRSLAAILFLDLDHFKLINDSLGHHVGDELLVAAAPRLKQAVRSSDTVARFGGDEFGILLEDISGERDAVEMAERIASIFTRPFVLDGAEHFVTASIGIALAQGGDVAEELIRDADAAMYRSKERGRARYELFDEMLRGRAISRLRVENDLRRALERGELRLVYQPIVSLRDLSIVSLEALVRWEHPERGMIPPSEFIPVAEENGLIEPIGRWVLERACRQAERWHRARPDAPPLGMSVNLSAVQVAKGGLAESVSSVLQATGLDPMSLSLEITETAMLSEADALAEALAALKATGVRLVLDDFGTGYSSLSHLTHLPLDALKVDRSFVDGLGTEAHDTAITEAIIAMSRALSLDVIAEGVEKALQADQLSARGCGLAQGFFFSRPLPAREISSMLRDSGSIGVDYQPKR